MSSAGGAVLACRGLQKTYGLGDVAVPVLKGIDLDVGRGESVAIVGASPGSIMKIFVVQGAVIGIVGTLLGVIAGVLLALNIDTVVPFVERSFGFQILSREVYYISELPSDLHWRDVWTVALVSLLLAFVATIYPSWRASRVNPAEALRYE